MKFPKGCWQLIAVLSLLSSACSQEQTAERAKEAAERVRASLGDVDAKALAQKVDEATIKKVQTELQAIDEYQGEITGSLDRVTLNAIQAFQRAHGLDDDGILNRTTRERLASAARH